GTSRCFLQCHLNANGATFRVGVALEACISRDALVLLRPRHQLAIGAGAKRLCRGKHKHRFEDVRLSGAIRSVEDRNARREAEIESLIGPKMTEPESSEQQV